jgi:hypothetical protein
VARYYFVVRWSDREHEDRDGTELPGPEAARDYARRIIRELKDGGGYDEPGLIMVVTDAEGKIVYTEPFATRH